MNDVTETMLPFPTAVPTSADKEISQEQKQKRPTDKLAVARPQQFH